MLTMMTGIRPKIWLKLAKFGWKTVDASKNEVPDQKASMAVPFNLCAMIGKATDIDVPSNATIRVKTDRAANAMRKRVEISKVGGVAGAPSFGSTKDDEEEVFWDSCCSCW